jgi:glycosyltransferase involved in cell wall biosynthesis
MKILIVTPLLTPEPGGPSYLSVSLKEALEKKGENVDLIAFRDVRKYPSGIRHFIFLYKVLWRARKADALIILDTVSVALPAVFAGWLLGKKTVVRAGGDFVWERYIERTGDAVLLSEFYNTHYKLTKKEKVLILLQKYVVLRLASKVVFNTQWQCELWRKPYKMSVAKTGVVGNAYIPTTREHTGGKAFLCAWRSTAFKNINTLETAYQKAKETCPDIQLNIYKNIPREELYKHMETAHALVVPSLTELSPNMALEALSMGLPVILTKDCGAYDLLDGVVTWINPLEPNDIAEKMCALMDNERYKVEKEKAKKFSYTHTYEEIADEFLALLKK